jgi:hypothetical protein
MIRRKTHYGQRKATQLVLGILIRISLEFDEAGTEFHAVCFGTAHHIVQTDRNLRPLLARFSGRVNFKPEGMLKGRVQPDALLEPNAGNSPG